MRAIVVSNGKRAEIKLKTIKELQLEGHCE